MSSAVMRGYVVCRLTAPLLDALMARGVAGERTEMLGDPAWREATLTRGVVARAMLRRFEKMPIAAAGIADVGDEGFYAWAAFAHDARDRDRVAATRHAQTMLAWAGVSNLRMNVPEHAPWAESFARALGFRREGSVAEIAGVPGPWRQLIRMRT